MGKNIDKRIYTQAEELDRNFPNQANIACKWTKAKVSKEYGMTKYLFEDGSSIVVGEEYYYILNKGVTYPEYVWEKIKYKIECFLFNCWFFIWFSFTTKDGFKKLIKKLFWIALFFLVVIRYKYYRSFYF